MTIRRTFLKQLFFFSGGLLTACAGGQQSAVTLSAAQTPTAARLAAATQTAAATRPSAEKPEVKVLASGLAFPEGPAFDLRGGLWCTELEGGNLVKLVDGQPKRYPIGGAAGGRGNGLAFDLLGRAWVADSGRNAIQRFDPAAETWETVLDKIDGQPLQSPNDLAFDSAGNLLFTCPNFGSTSATGYVVCLRPDGTATKIVEGFNRPNGLDLVDGGLSLVVADTFRKTLFKGKWDAEAAVWHDPQPWALVGGKEGPDGMVPGADGLLYQAIYGDGVIRVVNGQGQVQRELQLPGSNPTNAAIDPSGQLGLVVTETENGQLLSLPGIQPGVALFSL